MFRKGDEFPLVDDAENEVKDGGEARAGVLSAGGESNRLVAVG